MISISKTPLRISFFGGGTDYPEYFKRHNGMVVGSTINQYIYINSLPLKDFCEQKFKFSYSQIDSVDKISDIRHPVIKAVLENLSYEKPLNVSVMSDIPGGTGLGSSSAFTVGFLNLISHLNKRSVSRLSLAEQAIFIEREILKENVGVQDQLHAAFGGLSCYSLGDDGYKIRPINLRADNQLALDNSMFLLFTNIERRASNILNEQIKNTATKIIDSELSHLKTLAQQSVAVFEQNSSDQMISELGAMLDESWKTKRKLSSKISNTVIDDMYDKMKALGGLGGKLCGAGAGGFILCIAKDSDFGKFEEAFGVGNVIRIKTENFGSRILTVDDL